MPPSARLYPPWIAWAGLAGCLFVAFQIQPAVWLSGLGVLIGGLVFRWSWRRLSGAVR